MRITKVDRFRLIVCTGSDVIRFVLALFASQRFFKRSKDVKMFVSIFFYSSNASFSIIKIKLLALGQYINKYHIKIDPTNPQSQI